MSDITNRTGADGLKIEDLQQYEARLEKSLQKYIEEDISRRQELSLDEYTIPGEDKSDPFNYYRKKVNQSWRMQKCYFSYHGTQDLHYANTPLLTMFVSKYGNVLPRSQTFLTAKMQRKLARIIRRSRQIGLMPFTGTWHSLRSGDFPPEFRQELRRQAGLAPLTSLEPSIEEVSLKAHQQL
jgi:small subunit ribosomal protein S18